MTMTLLFFSDISWDGLIQRPHHLAKHFAKEYPVLWIEPVVLSRRPSFTPVMVRKNLYTLSLPLFPYNARQKGVRIIASLLSRVMVVRSLIRRLQVRILRKAVGRLGMDEKKLIFFFENIHSARIVDSFTPSCVCFDYIDNAFGFVSLPPHVRTDWEYLVRRADMVFVTSPTLRRQVEESRSEDITLVSNGVEYDFFSRAENLPRPYDMPTDKPIIGYVGAVYPWFDFELIDALCRNLPAMNVVLIGRAHPDSTDWIERLTTHPNFFFLGFREYQSIPSYVHLFSVAIIPFLKNELTEAVNPVKLYEYCAAGIPVIATDFSLDLRSAAPYVTIVHSHGEWFSAITEAIARKSDDTYIRQLQAFASHNDWDGKAGEILRSVKSHIRQ